SPLSANKTRPVSIPENSPSNIPLRREMKSNGNKAKTIVYSPNGMATYAKAIARTANRAASIQAFVLLEPIKMNLSFSTTIRFIAFTANGHQLFF
ncbi:MAG: hypothetical protein WA035_10330, partial [Trichococcus flocculiformis]